jgi:dolichol-phosphate mannosyltransferase
MRAVMVVPTYDEVTNLASIVARLRAAQPEVDVLVVDDASPDGTGALADELALADPRVQVLHRAQKRGLGKAYLDGFAWALRRDYDVVGQMDADGSHQPEQLGRLLEALCDPAAPADLVIGSRWVRGGSIENWPVHRELLSRGGNLYTRALLGISVRDATSGYRLLRRTALGELDLATIASSGYVFQVDLVVRALRAGLRVVEVPIEFVERERGDSKMDTKVAVESLRRITAWGLGERRRQVARVLRPHDSGTQRPPKTLDKP